MLKQSKVLKQKNRYNLKIVISDQKLKIDMQVLSKPMIQSRFQGNFSDEQLSNEIVDKFGGIDNIYSLFDDHNNYEVKQEKGEILLKLEFALPNGKKISHSGCLILTPIESSGVDSRKVDQLQHLLEELRDQLIDNQQVQAKRERLYESKLNQLAENQHNQQNLLVQQIKRNRQYIEVLRSRVEDYESKQNYLQPEKAQNLSNSRVQLQKSIAESLVIEQMQNKLIKMEKHVSNHEKSINSYEQRLPSLEKNLNILGQKCEIQENIINKVLDDVKEYNMMIGSAKNEKVRESKPQSIKQQEVFPSLGLNVYSNPRYKQQFAVDGRKIRYIGENRSKIQFLFAENLRNNSNYQISFRITQTEKREISIGVIDEKYGSEKCANGVKFPNYIRYEGQFGGLYEAGKLVYEEGEDYGFSEGHIVQMTVNTVQGSIQWAVDDQVRIKHNSDKLKSPSIVWVPHIVFYRQKDTIQLRKP